MYKFLIVLLLLGGCATDINRVNQDRYYHQAAAAQSRGDWDAARRAWARVVVNSRTSGASIEQQAVFHYEYGRSLGVTCFFAEAETELLQAYQLDVETDGPAYMSLTELARLHLDQQHYAEAAQYFQRMLNEADEGVLPQAPAEHAAILDEFAEALAGMGDVAQAGELREEAAAIRRAHPQAPSITERTPYGRHCPSN